MSKSRINILQNSKGANSSPYFREIDINIKIARYSIITKQSVDHIVYL
jgi:hypothetical protein